MVEKLSKVQRSNLRRQQKFLKIVKSLRAGVYTTHGISPSKEELEEYHAAIKGLSSKLGQLPNAIYDIYLNSVGNYHNLYLGVSNIDLYSVSTEELRRTTENIIIGIEENSKWRSEYSATNEDRGKGIEKVIKNIIKNKGYLEYFDRITFFMC